MPVDFYLNSEFDTEWNEVGDVSKVRGSEYVQQTVSVAIVENVGLHIGAFSPTNIEQHRGQIESVVSNHHATTDSSVTVDEIDEDEKSVTYLVQSNEAEFTMST